VDKTLDDVKVEAGFQYTTGEELDRVRCYANNAYNPGGGTHMSGFRTAITRALTAYGNKENLFKDTTPQGEDYRAWPLCTAESRHQPRSGETRRHQP